MGAYIYLFRIRAYHSLSNKQTEKHPRGSILYTVKCASRKPVPRAHYGEYYTTPRGSHPCICLGLLIRFVEVSMDPKTKRDNAFQYVVLRPSAPSSSNDIPATSGRCSCKSTKKIGIKCSKSKKSAKKFGRQEKKCLSFQRQNECFNW